MVAWLIDYVVGLLYGWLVIVVGWLYGWLAYSWLT